MSVCGCRVMSCVCPAEGYVRLWVSGDICLSSRGQFPSVGVGLCLVSVCPAGGYVRLWVSGDVLCLSVRQGNYVRLWVSGDVCLSGRGTMSVCGCRVMSCVCLSGSGTMSVCGCLVTAVCPAGGLCPSVGARAQFGEGRPGAPAVGAAAVSPPRAGLSAAHGDGARVAETRRKNGTQQAHQITA